MTGMRSIGQRGLKLQASGLWHPIADDRSSLEDTCIQASGSASHADAGGGATVIYLTISTSSPRTRHAGAERRGSCRRWHRATVKKLLVGC